MIQASKYLGSWPRNGAQFILRLTPWNGLTLFVLHFYTAHKFFNWMTVVKTTESVFEVFEQLTLIVRTAIVAICFDFRFFYYPSVVKLFQVSIGGIFMWTVLINVIWLSFFYRTLAHFRQWMKNTIFENLDSVSKWLLASHFSSYFFTYFLLQFSCFTQALQVMSIGFSMENQLVSMYLEYFREIMFPQEEMMMNFDSFHDLIKSN